MLGGSFPLFLVYYGVNRLLKNKYTESSLYRLGLKFAGWDKLKNRPIWVHALSVGETVAAIPLIKEIRCEFPDTEILFSTSTETGQQTAKKKLKGYVSQFFYMPHDFAWAVKRLLKNIVPRLFITIETDAWPNLIFGLKELNIPAFLVNGRLSPRSFERFYKFRRFSGALFNEFDLCLMQSACDVEKLLRIGVKPEKVKNTGNLKFDVLPSVSEYDRKRLREELGVETNSEIWIAGSTHEGEEESILDSFVELINIIPDLRLILVPRHPSRACNVRNLVHQKGLSYSLRSRDVGFGETKVLIVDTLGELAKLYSVASVAFIGGSLVSVGGHNPLEALAFGVPVIFGPHMFNFREIESLLLGYGAAVKVSSGFELKRVMKQLFTDPNSLKTMKKASTAVLEENRGTTSRVLRYLRPYLTRSIHG